MNTKYCLQNLFAGRMITKSFSVYTQTCTHTHTGTHTHTSHKHSHDQKNDYTVLEYAEDVLGKNKVPSNYTFGLIHTRWRLCQITISTERESGLNSVLNQQN